MLVKKNSIKTRERLKKNKITFDKVLPYVIKQSGGWSRKASNFGYAYEDLHNEAHLVFLICIEKYTGESKYGSHFFSFFVTCLLNHYKDIFQCWDEKDRRDVLGDSISADEELINGSYSLATSISHVLLDASEDVVKALNFLVNAPDKELARWRVRSKGNHGFGTNEEFCRMLGIDPTINIKDKIKKFLTKP